MANERIGINRYIVGCKVLTKWSNTKGIKELIDT